MVGLPFAWPLAELGHFIGRRLVMRAPVNPRVAETEVEWMVNQGERAGALANEPAEISIRNVLEFKEFTARDVMVPRRLIVGIEMSTRFDNALAIVASEGHSRYPVYRETPDNIVGLLYVKDLFTRQREGNLGDAQLADVVRTPVLFVAETQSISAVLREMRARRLHWPSCPTSSGELQASSP